MSEVASDSADKETLDFPYESDDLAMVSGCPDWTVVGNVCVVVVGGDGDGVGLLK
jgi:hypothetical protein